MKKQKNYFDTTKLPKNQLKEAVNKATVQDKRVLTIFKRKKRPMTPAEVWDVYCKLYPACPITSIRRSMTVLTEKGKLEKTDKLKKGIYGKPNHVWRLK